MLSFQREQNQFEKVQLIVAELQRRAELDNSEEAVIQLLKFIGRANAVIHRLQVQIEHKNILNHEVALLVDEWNEML
ncbi:hypothetical protein [Vibrio parahaemolyticus]|uniref:hypothetical protein n=1 Tax=Vibrio parahaemolyticus TaxID=670 RepID=UPI001123B254|nr:hypothetical protein [Vibrio parahaemolyticus]TOJ29434.1 hypothetical protein CGI43_07520 [Vibrio parahaemolyticus]